jgi:hypothetical protein
MREYRQCILGFGVWFGVKAKALLEALLSVTW